MEVWLQMAGGKHIRTILQKRALVIHHGARLRRQLADGLIKSGWEVLEAEGRNDGMPILFDVHPTLIFLEVSTEQADSWETFHNIRLLTDTPVILLADQASGWVDQAIDNSNTVVVAESLSVTQILAIAKTLGKYSSTRALPSRRGVSSTTLIAPLQRLTSREVSAIDRALSQFCDADEVRLVVRGGRLKSIARLRRGPLGSGPASQ